MATIAPVPVPAGPAVPDSSNTEATFDAQWEAFNAWAKNDLQPGINALAVNVKANADDAATSASTATTQAGLATTNGAAQVGLATTQAGNAAASSGTATTQAGISTAQAAAAAASAASAAAIAGAFVGTSATSWTPAIAPGQVFTTQTGEQYTAGVFLMIVSAGTPGAWGFGQVTTYAGSTLTMDMQVIAGSGAHTDWNISLIGPRGPAGAGITPQTVGFTATAGTTPHTLTVTADVTLSEQPQALLVSGTNIKTINGTSPLGAGNLVISVGAPTIQVFSGAPTGTFARAASKTGTYSQTTTVGTATITAHGLAVGDRVYLDQTSGTSVVDGWATVATVADVDHFTVTRASNTTSGNVTMYPPIVITITSQAAHGLSTSGLAYVDFSGTYTDGSNIVYQATTSTFQVELGTVAVGSGTVNLLSVPATFTYTKPAGLSAAKVTVVASGGQGSVNSTLSSAVGGAAGGIAIKLVTASAIGTTETVTVSGTACTMLASSGASGQTGGTSSFGAICSATGGIGVMIHQANTGTGVGGSINILGASSPAADSSYSGDGANSLFGSGGVGKPMDVIAGNATGYGAGGGGAGTSTTVTGGFGSPGIVIVEEFY